VKPGEPAAEWSQHFVEALQYAAVLHGDQRRKGPAALPYIGHLLGVAGIVIANGGEEEEAIAALLHDAAEDQGGEPQLEVIRERFGDRVASIVRGVALPLYMSGL
jgi:(p)ppGpp synthase/HD superfamily hydrolase